GADPRACHFAMAILLKLFEQIVQAAAQYVSAITPGEEIAQSALQQVAEPAGATRHTRIGGAAARHYAGANRIGRRLAAGEAVERLVTKQGEHRHRDRRHPSAASTTGGARPARAVLHTVEHIE